MPTVELLTHVSADLDLSRQLIFGTLPAGGLNTMTPDGVEFVLCASALTAQM
ncbi:hypothetical protein [Cryobacterium sp. TMS1-20-1]|uniref:hypothetical protein n=1 Tax=Cryobacterium sp. TMS1-20-1 TaxID=1259223 RepID=UPI00141B048C|nr:hypothetical protein [Cryobacterium sp. TMS1-20-1]